MTSFNPKRFLVIDVLIADFRCCQVFCFEAEVDLISKPGVFPNHRFPPLLQYWGTFIWTKTSAKAILLPGSRGCVSDKGQRSFPELLGLLPLNSGATSHPCCHFCTAGTHLGAQECTRCFLKDKFLCWHLKIHRALILASTHFLRA